MFVCLNGTFVKAREAKISLFDHGFLYGDGVYETLRTYNGNVWQLDEHLVRLENSARMLALKLPYSRREIGDLVEKLVQKNGFSESRIRITLTRGVNGFDFLQCRAPTFVVIAEKLQPQPPDVYKNGVKVVTVRLERTLPKVKSLNLLPLVLAQQEVAKARAYEALLVDHKGYVREGTITNVFLVKNSVLWTPKSNVLPGTTRAAILRLARKEKLPVRVTDFTIRKLSGADEMFLTNAPRGIMPVRQVDGHRMGRPGPVTKTLMQAFNDYIATTCG